MQVFRIVGKSAAAWFLLSLIWQAIPPNASGGEPALVRGQTVYVPVYSHIYVGDRESPFYLAATVSVRNTDPKQSITFISADYYDSEGRLLKRFLETPFQLKAMASSRYVIAESDTSGGSGASFVVKWRSDKPVNPPIVESVMISTRSQQGVSFTSRGQAIEE